MHAITTSVQKVEEYAARALHPKTSHYVQGLSTPRGCNDSSPRLLRISRSFPVPTPVTLAVVVLARMQSGTPWVTLGLYSSRLAAGSGSRSPASAFILPSAIAASRFGSFSPHAQIVNGSFILPRLVLRQLYRSA